MRSIHLAVLLFIASAASAGILYEAGYQNTLPQPANTPVWVQQNGITEATSVLVGSGITLPEGRATRSWVSPGGEEIIWRQVRNEVDKRGGKHVFYRQFLSARGQNVELVGSEVGLHYSAAGVLRSIMGHQFISATVANQPVLARERVADRIVERLQSHPHFQPERLGRMSDADRHYRSSHAELKLVQRNGADFYYAWFSIARNLEHVEHQVVIDAGSEEILAVTPLHLGGNCHPSQYQSVTAIGEPVRPDLRAAGVRRSLLANVSPDRSTPFTHEAFYRKSTTLPQTRISILQETSTQAFKCHSGAPASYTLIPLMTDDGTPVYRDRSTHPEWLGHAAGDAIHNTNETMAAFQSLGRSGWDNQNGDANIVLESTFLGQGYLDTAFFRMSGNGDSRVPPTSFMGITPTLDYYHPSASLDHIAHEWGHGVIFTSVNFPITTTVGLQLHEGFADVVGQSVERLRQPAGSGLEQGSDFTMHEDTATGGYARGAIDDAAGHDWIGLNGASRTFNDFLHRQDQPTLTQPHSRGNMLHVVLRLLIEGGQNPICARQPGYAGCGVGTTALGTAKAVQILFDALTWYTPSSARWEDLATYASQAAFDLYSTCDGSGLPRTQATTEQRAVDQAFTAIGYPRLTPARECPYP